MNIICYSLIVQDQIVRIFFLKTSYNMTFIDQKWMKSFIIFNVHISLIFGFQSNSLFVATLSYISFSTVCALELSSPPPTLSLTLALFPSQVQTQNQDHQEPHKDKIKWDIEVKFDTHNMVKRIRYILQ